jgi:hypothetical protein
MNLPAAMIVVAAIALAKVRAMVFFLWEMSKVRPLVFAMA